MRFHGVFFHGVLKLFSSRYVVIVSWPSLGLRFHGASMVLWRAPIVRIVSILRGAILNRTNGTDKNLYDVPLFLLARKSWSYLLLSPVIAQTYCFRGVFGPLLDGL